MSEFSISRETAAALNQIELRMHLAKLIEGCLENIMHVAMRKCIALDNLSFQEVSQKIVAEFRNAPISEQESDLEAFYRRDILPIIVQYLPAHLDDE